MCYAVGMATALTEAERLAEQRRLTNQKRERNPELYRCLSNLSSARYRKKATLAARPITLEAANLHIVPCRWLTATYPQLQHLYCYAIAYRQPQPERVSSYAAQTDIAFDRLADLMPIEADERRGVARGVWEGKPLTASTAKHIDTLMWLLSVVKVHPYQQTSTILIVALTEQPLPEDTDIHITA